MFDSLVSVAIFLLGGVASVAFWVFISRGDVYDNWYPLTGHLVASHGAFFGIIIHEYLQTTGKSIRDIFKKDK